jgi:hypothetical protein
LDVVKTPSCLSPSAKLSRQYFLPPEPQPVNARTNRNEHVEDVLCDFARHQSKDLA